jgi:hypothetical protein
LVSLARKWEAFSPLVAPNSAPKMQSSQDLFARPKRENGLHSLANITFDPIGDWFRPTFR